MLIPLLIATVGPALACEPPATGADVQAGLAEAEHAWSSGDLEAHREAVEAARDSVGCLTEKLDPTVIAALHRAVGLAELDRRGDLDLAAFTAARRLEPDAQLALLPEDHPALDLYARAEPHEVAVTAIPAPASGRVELDGRSDGLRPEELPAVVQVFSDSGAVLTSRYLEPRDRLPGYEAADDDDVHPRARRNFALLSLGTGMGAGAMYAITRASAAADARDEEASESPRYRTQSLASATVVLGGVAVGAGLGAVFVASW